MELALTEGVCLMTGQQMGVKTPPVSEMKSIDDVIDAVCVQLIGIVPEDAAVSHCAVRGEPLPASSAAAKAFSRIAKRIDGGVSPLLG